MPVTELPDNHSRPYYAEELKALYAEAEEYTTPFDATTIKADTVTDTDTSIESFRALWPFADETAFNTAVTALKATIATDIDNNIADTLDASIAYHTILDDMKDDFDALVQSEGYTNPCPECQTTGLAPTYNADGSLTGETIESAICNGYGYTLGTEDPFTLDGNSKRFIQVP